MTRLELLQLVLGRARANGFQFRRWYTTRLGLPWISSEAALAILDSQRRYYALVFSHEFAQSFWKPGAEITFDVPPQTFQRAMADGSIRTVQRKSYIRRSTRPNAWRYHLRQMALAEEPLRYLRRYLHLEQTPDPPDEGSELRPSADAAASTAPKPAPEPAKRAPATSLDTSELPAFLRRPYRPAEKVLK